MTLVDLPRASNGRHSPSARQNRRRRLFERLEDRHLLAVTLAVDATEIAEAEGAAVLTASLSAAVTQDVTVELGLSGSAAEGADYTASSTSVVISAGSQSGTVNIIAVQDTEDEPDETIVVDVTSVVGDTEDGTQQVTVTIVDDDAPNIAASVVPAPIAPDGDVVGAATDLVINLDRSLDPSIAGRTLLEGNTIKVTLPAEFINTGSLPFADIFGSTTCTPGNVQCSTAILVEGWPQNPIAPFVPPRPEGQGTQLYSVTLEGTNTIVYTALRDLVPGTPSFGPGIKQLHLLLQGFTNPTVAGLYDIEVAAETGPDGALETGTVQVEILAEQRPAISVTSVFNAGNPNTIYQAGPAGGPLPLPYDFLLWGSDGLPLVGVEIQMVDDTRALLRQADTTIGEVLIESPAGATGNLLSSRGPSVEINAPVSGTPAGRLTADFAIGSALGDYELTFTLNGGNSQKMFITAINVAPMLTDPGRQTLAVTQDTLDVALEATDANSADTLSFSATPRTAEYYLDQTIGLNFTGDLFTNFGGLGEKWLQSDDGTWHYITPDGNLYEWLGGAVLNRVWVAQLATATFDDPSLLYDAQADAPAPATAAVAGSTLTLDPTDGFIGSFSVEISVSDGTNTDSAFILVDVVDNDAPVLSDPGNQTLPTTQDVLDVPLQATDSTNDPITFSATVESGEYYLDQTLGLEIFEGNLFENWSGSLDEKWVLGDNGTTWYFITPDGSFWRWLGGDRDIAPNSELVATLSPATYADPALLSDAQRGAAVPATATVADTTLTLNPNDGFVGMFAVMVTATDSGGLSDSQLIRVDVTPAPGLTAGRGVPALGRPATERDSTLQDKDVQQDLTIGFSEDRLFNSLNEADPTLRRSDATSDEIDTVLELFDASLVGEQLVSDLAADLFRD